MRHIVPPGLHASAILRALLRIEERVDHLAPAIQRREEQQHQSASFSGGVHGAHESFRVYLHGRLLVADNQVLLGALERFTALLVTFERHLGNPTRDMPDQSGLDRAARAGLHLYMHDAVPRHHRVPGARKWLVCRRNAAKQLALQNIAGGLVGVRDHPGVDRPIKASALPPGRIEPREVHSSLVYPGFTLAAAVGGDKGDLAMIPAGPEELQVLGIKLPADRPSVREHAVQLALAAAGHLLFHHFAGHLSGRPRPTRRARCSRLPGRAIGLPGTAVRGQQSLEFGIGKAGQGEPSQVPDLPQLGALHFRDFFPHLLLSSTQRAVHFLPPFLLLSSLLAPG